MIGNISISAGKQCNSMLRSAHKYWNKTISFYQLQQSPGSILLVSLVHNQIQNILNISNSLTSLISHINSNNQTGTWYDLGRLARILLIFPIVQQANDTNFYIIQLSRNLIEAAFTNNNFISSKILNQIGRAHV